MKPFRVVTVCIVFILAGLLLAACASQPTRQEPAARNSDPTPMPTAVAAARTTYAVTPGDVVYDASFSGRVAPVIEEPLAFAMDGVVSVVHVDKGDLVAAGDILAELNTQALAEDLLLAQQALTIAQSRLENSENQRQQARRRAEIAVAIAQLNLDQAKTQAGDTPSTDQQFNIDRLALQLELTQLDLDALSTDIDPALQAEVDQAALRVAEVEKLVEDAVLKAPFSGQLLSLNLSEGYAVSAFQPVGSIADMEQLEVNASLRENQMEELAEGMPVLLSPGSRPGEAVPGVIRKLPYPFGAGGGGTEVGDSDTRTHFSFDNPEDAAGFEPGDLIDINVVIQIRNDVLTLPSSAIRDFNGRKFVVVEEGDVQERVDVELGISGNGLVEIISGLEEGQIIVGQ